MGEGIVASGLDLENVVSRDARQDDWAARAQRLADAARKRYEETPWMQGDEIFKDPLHVVSLIRDQDGISTSYAYVVQALHEGGRVDSGDIHRFTFVAGAAQYFDDNHWLHMRRRMRQPFEALDFLRVNRARARSTKSPFRPQEEDRSNSLAYLMVALWTGNIIPRDEIQTFEFAAGAADYYDQSEMLQSAPVFTDPFQAVSYLRERRPDGISLSYLTLALWTAEKIPHRGFKSFQFIANSADYYERNTQLHEGPESFDTPHDAVEFLLERKQNGESLSYMVQSLWTAERIPHDKLQLFQFYAGAADYALERREMIEAQVVKHGDKYRTDVTPRYRMQHVKKAMDKTLFTRRDDPHRMISRTYFNLVMRAAMNLYGDEILGKINKT